MIMQLDVEIREVNPQDMCELLELIKLSTKQSTKLTTLSLQNALFGFEVNSSTVGKTRESGVNFDVTGVKSNGNTCRSFVVEKDGGLIGYIIFHFHYSPWWGHNTLVDDIFVMQSYEKTGKVPDRIIDRLIKEAEKLSRHLGTAQFIFNQSSPGSNYLLNGSRDKVNIFRDDKTDWGVRRIIWN